MKPTSGTLDAQLHCFPIRVYYEDTDAAGIVYYANYLKFAERARTEYLRLLGVDQTKLKDSDGVFFAVRRAEVEYLKPVRLDDELEVRTKLTSIGASVIDALQLICRGDEVMAQVVMRVVCISAADGKPARIPRRLREAWLPYIAAA